MATKIIIQQFQKAVVLRNQHIKLEGLRNSGVQYLFLFCQTAHYQSIGGSLTSS